MKLSLLGLSVALAALLAACGSADQNTSNNGGNGGEGNYGSGGFNTNTGGSSAGGSDTGGNSTGGSNTGGNSTGGSDTGGNTGTGGSTMMPDPCGGEAGVPCADTQYCDFPDDMCGGNDSTGTCVDKPSDCPDVSDPVCACDGSVYASACVAAVNGVDIQAQGGCDAPPGTFACGAGFCDTAMQYCEVQVSDVAGLPNTYQCKPLPTGCQGSGTGCACLANEPCGDMCAVTNGGFTLTCPGG